MFAKEHLSNLDEWRIKNSKVHANKNNNNNKKMNR